MLSLLLDEQISPVIAEQVALRRPGIPIQSVYRWREGALTGQPDVLVLRAAGVDGLTLVTYDLRTIPPLLSEWGATGTQHGGVIFVNASTIRSSEFGRLTRALIQAWDREHAATWTDRIVFLEAP